ncbi:hypothetical protein BH11MYX1_BH11MYX1_04770 [soil metagenome]
MAESGTKTVSAAAPRVRTRAAVPGRSRSQQRATETGAKKVSAAAPRVRTRAAVPGRQRSQQRATETGAKKVLAAAPRVRARAAVPGRSRSQQRATETGAKKNSAAAPRVRTRAAVPGWSRSQQRATEIGAKKIGGCAASQGGPVHAHRGPTRCCHSLRHWGDGLAPRRPRFGIGSDTGEPTERGSRLRHQQITSEQVAGPALAQSRRIRQTL